MNVSRLRALAASMVILATGLAPDHAWTVAGPAARVHAEGPHSSPLANEPVPTVSLSLPQEVLIGEDFHMQVLLQNTGGSDGYAPYVELWLPAAGLDGSMSGPCDGVSFVSAVVPVGNTIVTVDHLSLGYGPINALNAQPTTKLFRDFSGSAISCTGMSSIPAMAEYHPYYYQPGTAAPTMPLTVQDQPRQLALLELPFVKLAPGESVIADVTVHVSNLLDADGGAEVAPWARGGFRYGDDVQYQPSSDPIEGQPVFGLARPTVMQFGIEDAVPGPAGSCADGVDNGADGFTDVGDGDCNDKVYLGPEDEAVTGPNMTGVYPLAYVAYINIADGQTLTDLVVTDTVPPGMTIVGVTSTPAGATVSPANFTGPGQITVAWPGLSLTGTAKPDDVRLEIRFYLEDIVDHDTCAVVELENTIQANANLPVPLDPRDDPTVASTGLMLPVPDHILKAKCIAVQKGVAIDNDVPPTGPSPGDTLKYTLSFQVSDYMAFGNFVLEDMLSDGQDFYAAAAPTLFVGDRHGAVQDSFPNGQRITVEPTDSVCLGVTGGTSIRFDITQRLQDLKLPSSTYAGILTGGHAYLPTSTTPALGRIVFWATIREDFIDPSHQPGDEHVVKHDPMVNCATLTGERYDVDGLGNIDATGVMASDDSATRRRIVAGDFGKTVYAINGQVLTSGGSSPQVAAGDTLTFRLRKEVLTGDAEEVVLEDWLPGPFLSVADPNADGIAGPGWLPLLGIPSAGEYAAGPDMDPSLWPALKPGCGQATFNDDGKNSLCFDFGSFDIVPSPLTPRVIDLLFTVAVQPTPYADGTTLLNRSEERELDSYDELFTQASGATIELTEPELRVHKAVVWASNPAPFIDFEPAKDKPVPFGPGPGCGRFSSPIDSNALAGGVTTRVTHVDGGDTVTFAIIVENVGSGLNGAFDVSVIDTLPQGFNYVPGTMCVEDGTGTTLGYSKALPGEPAAVDGDLFVAPGIRVGDPGNTPTPLGGLDPYSPTGGQNIAVIYYDATLDPGIAATGPSGCYHNDAHLTHYAAAEEYASTDPPNFVTAGFVMPFGAEAEVCVLSEATKSIVTTSVPETMPDDWLPGQPTAPTLTIGEIVRYRVEVALPEGLSKDFAVVDPLPEGLAFVDDGSARWELVSNGGGIVSTPPVSNAPGEQTTVGSVVPSHPFGSAPATIAGGPFGCDNPNDPNNPAQPNVPAFRLGNLTNTDQDDDREYVVLEFTAQVCNVPANQQGKTMQNEARVLVEQNGQAVVAALTNAAPIELVEPYLSSTKTVPIAPQPGNTGTVTLIFVNTGLAPAFGVEITDPLPDCISIDESSMMIAGSAGVQGLTQPTLNGQVIAAAADLVPVGDSITLTFEATIDCFTGCESVLNTAHVEWTSLWDLHGYDDLMGNLTDSMTPGTPGTSDGERTGTGGTNDYFANPEDSPCIKISGVKFQDDNGDCVRDLGEPGLGGWAIRARASNGAILDNELTAPDGTYTLYVDPAQGSGIAKICEIKKSTFTQTCPTTADGCYDLNLGGGGPFTGIDFGNQPITPTPGTPTPGCKNCTLFLPLAANGGGSQAAPLAALDTAVWRDAVGPTCWWVTE